MQKLWPQLRNDRVQFVAAGNDFVANNKVPKTLQVHFGNIVDLCHQNLRKKSVLSNARGYDVFLSGIAHTQAKAPHRGKRGFHRTSLAGGSLAMHKQGEQKNDWERNAKKPEQRASPKAHNNLLPAICPNNAAVPMKFPGTGRKETRFLTGLTSP